MPFQPNMLGGVRPQPRAPIAGPIGGGFGGGQPFGGGVGFGGPVGSAPGVAAPVGQPTQGAWGQGAWGQPAMGGQQNPWGQPQIQGSFDNLKKTHTIKKDGLYRLKKGEKVVPLSALARAK